MLSFTHIAKILMKNGLIIKIPKKCHRAEYNYKLHDDRLFRNPVTPQCPILQSQI